jgi:hypothetical protein
MTAAFFIYSRGQAQKYYVLLGIAHPSFLILNDVEFT